MTTAMDHRMHAARQALAAAETAVGVRVPHAIPAGQVPSRPASPEPPGPPGPQPGAGAGNAPGLAVPPALHGVLPEGLQPGTITQIHGSTTVLLALAQAAAGQERWCALTGMPDVGWAAAATAGLDLTRVVAVPRPGPDTARVLGALVDGFDVLVVGDCSGLSAAQRRSLTGRLRHRGAVLLTDQHWPGAHVTLQVDALGWQGVGHGHGVLTGRELRVQRRGRGRTGGAVAQAHVLAGPRGLVAWPQQVPSGDQDSGPRLDTASAPRPVLAEAG